MAEKPGLDAVVFDAGGTLVRLDFEWMSEALAALGAPVEVARLQRCEIEGRRRYDASRGHGVARGELHPPLGSAGDPHAYFVGMLEAAGVPAERVEPAIDRFRERHRAGGLWSRPMEGARAAIDAVAAMGLRRAVVSNSDGRAEQHLVDCGLRAGIELVVDSQIEGVEKPDPEIFRIALRRLGVAAERAIYVGDIRCVDEAGAHAAGMPFALIDPYGDYAPPGLAAFPEIGRLPAWLGAHFTVGAAGRGPARGAAAPRTAS